MAKTVTLRMDDEIYELLLKHAEVERRSLSNYIEFSAVQHTKRMEFVDDEEMREMLANDDLIKRLKKGSGDAKNKKGKFVA